MDVTEKLALMLSRVTDFFAANQQYKASICDAVYNMTLDTGAYNFGNAWDICELAWQWTVFQEDGCGEVPCAKTVTVDGKCYATDDVNYALWGRIIRECSTVPTPLYRPDGAMILPLSTHLWLYGSMMRIPGYRAHADSPDPNHPGTHRPGVPGRQCWLLRGFGMDRSPHRSPDFEDMDKWCQEAAEEFSHCTPCDKAYTGNLHARMKSVTNTMPAARVPRYKAVIFNLSTSGVHAIEAPTVANGRHYANRASCGNH